jgi:hypothetical protein
VVPLPPPGNSGSVKFTTVALSLAYDDFGLNTPPVPVTIRILRTGGQVQVLNDTIQVGRKGVATLQPGDLAASITTHPVVPNQLPAVTALVEYTIP